MPLVRLAFVLMPQSRPEFGTELVLATLFRGVVVLFLGLWFARLAQLERDLDLKVKVLGIRNDAGEWERLEGSISRRSEAQFSHGLCPACGKKHYPDDL